MPPTGTGAAKWKCNSLRRFDAMWLEAQHQPTTTKKKKVSSLVDHNSMSFFLPVEPLVVVGAQQVVWLLRAGARPARIADALRHNLQGGGGERQVSTKKTEMRK